MSLLSWTVVTTVIAGIGGTGTGGMIGAICRKNSKKAISLMLSFAGGVMLGIVCFDLITDALNANNAKPPELLFIVLFGTLFGYAVIGILNALIDRHISYNTAYHSSTHLHALTSLVPLKQKKSSLFVAGIVMACAVALHNIPEGMVIGACFAEGPMTNMNPSGPDLALAIVIGLHNIPEGLAISVPLITGGMRRIKAVFITALSGAPTTLGAILGYRLGVMSMMMRTLSLCFASGAMLYVVFSELLPKSVSMWQSKLPAFSILTGVLTGLLIVYL